MNQLFSSRIKPALLKDALRKNRNFIVIFTIILFLTAPVPMLVELYYSGFQNIGHFSEVNLMVLNLLTTGLLIFVPFLFFNYLTKKSSVDFIHSLPISRGSLFLSYAAASLIIVLLPFTLTYWTSYIINYMFGSTGFEWQHLFTFLRLLLLFGSVQVPTLLVIMNTGTLSDSVIFSLILFIAPFIAFFALSEFTRTYLLGFSDLSSTNLLYFISPSTFFVASAIPDFISVDVNLVTGYWILFSIGMYVITCSAYRNWKSEFAERPFNNDYFYPFVISLFTVLLLIFMMSLFAIDYNASLQFLSPINLIIPILFTFVFYVVMDFIKHRTTKFFLKATKHFVYIIIFALSITTIVFSTQGFGYAWRIPDASKIDSVRITIDSFYDEFGDYDAIVRDSNDLKEVLEIHQELVLLYKEANGFFNNEISLNDVEAKLKIEYSNDGKNILRRNFSIPETFMVTLNKFKQIEDVAINKEPLFRDQIDKSITFDVYKPMGSKLVSFTAQDINNFEVAYAQDIQAIKTMNVTESNESNVVYLFKYSIDEQQEFGTQTNSYQIVLDERHTQSIAFLDSLDNINLAVRYLEFTDFNQDDRSYFYTPPYYNFEDSIPTSYEAFSNKMNNIITFSLDKTITSFIRIESLSNSEKNYVLPVYQ